MDQTTWVINVLDDSNKKSIKYENRIWLRRNVKKLNIRVCAEDCEVDFFEITKRLSEADAIIIQDGEEFGIRESRKVFWKSKEALLLLKQADGYLVFLYLPKQ